MMTVTKHPDMSLRELKEHKAIARQAELEKLCEVVSREPDSCFVVVEQRGEGGRMVRKTSVPVSAFIAALLK